MNLKVRPHSVHALMGENGAGKSTLKPSFYHHQKAQRKRLWGGVHLAQNGRDLFYLR
ncbi:galactose/methyl galaxtoside transporter ATP-binding protein [Vibrio cholerae]|nr:galactose/methyl galaxtoside transporter ATP-binding protein [Vibrio cholerae]